MKILYLNRHAKSSWSSPGLRDYDRPLNDRGIRDAEFMAKRFAKETAVDVLISSPAARALATAKDFGQALKQKDEQFLLAEEIYGASVKEMLQLIDNLKDEWHSAILFGHNPTFTDLAHYLDHSFNDHMVTCARVKIEFEIDSWSMVSADLGKVVYLDYPKLHE